MSSILKGIVKEVNPHNYDSDWDYYDAMNRKPRRPSEDDFVEPSDDEPIEYQPKQGVKPQYSINNNEDRQAGYNMTLVVKAPTTQQAEYAAKSFVDSNWGAKKQIGDIKQVNDGVVQVHMLDNHKHGYWTPWKGEPPISKGIEFKEGVAEAVGQDTPQQAKVRAALTAGMQAADKFNAGQVARQQANQQPALVRRRQGGFESNYISSIDRIEPDGTVVMVDGGQYNADWIKRLIAFGGMPGAKVVKYFPAMQQQGVAEELSRRDLLKKAGGIATGLAAGGAFAKGGGGHGGGGGAHGSSGGHASGGKGGSSGGKGGSAGAHGAGEPAHSMFMPGRPYAIATGHGGGTHTMNDADKQEYIKFLTSYADAIRQGRMTPQMRKWLEAHPEVIEDLRRGPVGLTMGQLNADLVDIENRRNHHLMTKESDVRDPGALATRKHISSQEQKHKEWEEKQKELEKQFYANHPELDDRIKEDNGNILDKELQDIDPSDEHHGEGDFTKNQIHTMLRVLKHLEHAIGDDEDLPEWVQMKIAQAQEMVVGVMDFMISDKERETERQTGDEILMKEQGVAEALDLGSNKYIVTYTNNLSKKTYTALVPADDEYEARDRVNHAAGLGTMVQNVKLARGNEPTDQEWKVYRHAGGPSQTGLYDRQQGVAEDWQKVNKSDKTDGMSKKAVKAYRRENPGSKLKTAVTKKPSELKPGSKDAKRRKSFCARMSGNKGPMKDEKGRPTPKAKALARWNCNEGVDDKEYRNWGEYEYELRQKAGNALDYLNEINPAMFARYGDEFLMNLATKLASANPASSVTKLAGEIMRHAKEGVDEGQIYMGGNKPGGMRKYKPKSVPNQDELDENLRTDNPCWKGYHPVGTKKKNGKTVPNCVPKESAIMKGLQLEGNDEEHQTGGSLGTPYPGTYEQETLPYRTKGQQRTQSIAFEDKE